MKKPLLLSALCVVLILCLDSVCYSQYVIKKISNNPYEDTNPRINNDGYVAWEGYDGTDWEIFLCNGIETIQLTDNSYDDINPQINDSGYVVWQGYEGPDAEIFLYDGTTTLQLTNNSYEDARPQINNNGYVVWEGQLLGGSNSSEIFLYDGATTIQLTHNSYGDYNPQISKNNGYVAWVGADANNVLQIFLYDGIEIVQLDSGFDDKEHPRINDKGHVVWFVGEAGQEGGIYLAKHRYRETYVWCLKQNLGDENGDPELNNKDHVVWRRWDGHDNEIRLFDFDNGNVQLTNNLNNDNEPKINNKGEIAWTRYTTRGPGIIIYNGVTFTKLTNSFGSGFNPQINDRGFVVFEGWNGADYDIYLASRVSVVSPGGGEVVPSGSPYMIRWIGPSVAVKYKVKYYLDNGLSWIQAHQEPFVTGMTLDWIVPAPDGNKRKCLVKVTGFNASDTVVSRVQSDKPFTIEVLRLTSPNAGEPPITSGGQHTITWTTNATVAPVDHIVLSYTLNDGLTWKTIDTTADLVDDGSFIWNVPTVAKQKDNCKVKIVLKDASGNTVGSDVSDGVFTILSPPLR